MEALRDASLCAAFNLIPVWVELHIYYNFGTFLRYLTDILYNAIPQDCSSRTLSYDMFMTLLFYDGT